MKAASRLQSDPQKVFNDPWIHNSQSRFFSNMSTILLTLCQMELS